MEALLPLHKTQSPCFHLQTQAANEDTVTCTTPQTFRIFPPMPLPRATLIPCFSNSVTTPSPIPNAFNLLMMITIMLKSVF
uniref:Uncharacterized protein n=1 Tax=Zosterops lateralis melanops TaxID=1220523 RepID=A0A8D2NNG0_ZOSLA